MLLALLIAVLAAALALVRGGSLEALARLRFRWIELLLAGLALQLLFGIWAPGWLSPGRALAVVLVSNLAVAVFVIGNRHLPGMALIGGGLLLNVLVIAANGAMPVSERAGEIAGLTDVHALDSQSIKHELLDADTLLPWLGDIIPLPEFSEIFSIGDVVLALGIGWLVYACTLPGRRRTREKVRT